MDNNYYSNGYGNYPNPPATVTSLVSSTMKSVYLKMTIALVVSGLTAWWMGTSQAYQGFLAANSWLMWVYIIGTFVFVFGISGAINRFSTTTCTVLFYLFAVLMGAMLSNIFIAYKLPAIAKTFFITAGTFGAMSIYGYTTSQDLSRFGNFLLMALFGVFIAMVVNIFLRSSGLEWIISILGVFIFVGLTAWDTQQVKKLAMVTPVEYRGKLATMGALNLYLDFINLFLFLLRIFGGSRD